MEQMRKPNSYVAPGLIRSPLSPNKVVKILTQHGKLWFLTTLFDIICKEQKVSKIAVFSTSRKPELVIARHLFRFYGWELLKDRVPYGDIALFLTNGRNRDHSIILRSKDLIVNSLDAKDDWGKNLRASIQNIDFKLNQISIDESDSTNRKGR